MKNPFFLEVEVKMVKWHHSRNMEFRLGSLARNHVGWPRSWVESGVLDLWIHRNIGRPQREGIRHWNQVSKNSARWSIVSFTCQCFCGLRFWSIWSSLITSFLVKTRVETVLAQEFANVVIQKPHISKAHAVLEPLGEIWLPISGWKNWWMTDWCLALQLRLVAGTLSIQVLQGSALCFPKSETTVSSDHLSDPAMACGTCHGIHGIHGISSGPGHFRERHLGQRTSIGQWDPSGASPLWQSLLPAGRAPRGTPGTLHGLKKAPEIWCIATWRGSRIIRFSSHNHHFPPKNMDGFQPEIHGFSQKESTWFFPWFSPKRSWFSKFLHPKNHGFQSMLQRIQRLRRLTQPTRKRWSMKSDQLKKLEKLLGVAEGYLRILTGDISISSSFHHNWRYIDN